MSKLTNKKIIYPVILLAILLLLSGIYWLKFGSPIKNPFKTKLKDVPQVQKEQIQKDLVSGFKAQKGFDVSLSGPQNDKVGSKLTGALAPSGDFQGKYEFTQPAQDEQPVSTQTVNIIKVGSDTYTKNEQDQTYQKNDKMFAYQLNIMAHPEDIQIQGQMPDQKVDGIVYSQYQIIFEKPGQEIVKEMSQELLDNIRMTGTILLHKQTLILKQMKLHQGKEEKASFTINYTPTDSAPKIEPPNI